MREGGERYNSMYGSYPHVPKIQLYSEHSAFEFCIAQYVIAHEHYISWENLNTGCSKNHVLLVQNMCSIELELILVCATPNSKHTKASFLPNSTDSLHLQLTRVPGSPDLVIFCIHDNNSLC